MATKKSVKKTSKKSVKKTAKKAAGKAKSIEEMPEPAAYRHAESGESLPLGVPEKKSSIPMYIVLVVLIAVAAFLVYQFMGRSTEGEMTQDTQTQAEIQAPPATAETPAKTEEKTVETVTPEANTYMIKKGDTFWGIAKSELGDGKRAKEIQDLNPGVVLKIGETLKMPAK